MAYCPICGTDHDPKTLCMHQGSDVSRRAGISQRSKLSSSEFKKLSRKASNALLIFLLRYAVGTFLVIIIFVVLRWLISQ
jgi:hypothetical protein